MPTRRRVLSLCGALSVSLAGCSTSDETTATEVDGPAQTQTPTNTPPTATATATETATATGTTTAVTIGTLRERSRAFVRGLTAEEYDRLLDEYAFTDTLAAQLDATRLEAIWTEETATVGQFVEISTVEGARVDGYQIVDVVVRFTAGTRIVRLSYTDSGVMAGLFVRNPHPSAAYSPPAYADQSTFTELDRTVTATDACELPAILTLPTGDGPVPGVVLVHGSGPNDMDETIGPNKPFTDLAWGLASRGVAVLRYDKRTYACDVDLAEVTLDAKVTNDALSALDVLRTHPRIAAERTVVVGHSIGAMVAPRIAARDGAVAGAIMLAANARPLPSLIPAQSEYLFRLDGDLSDQEAARLAEIEQTVERVRSLSIDDGEVVFGLGGRAFWRTVQAYDQVATATGLDVPCSFLQGERDYQVTVEADFATWQGALSDRESVTFRSYDALNHLFMPGEGQPSPSEYFKPNNVAQAVVADLAADVRAMTGAD
ncbi:MAG: alpha/beta fold hydrolase [Halorhabdus sp.]